MKITGRGDGAKVVAELPLQGTVGGAATLDESGETPALWIAGQNKEGKGGGDTLLRVEDLGTAFMVAP